MRPTPDPAPAGRRACDSSARRMSAALAAMGVLHFVRPEPFDGLIPPFLPGSARAWTHGSGVAELAVAGLLAVPRTRRAGGRAAQALFLKQMDSVGQRRQRRTRRRQHHQVDVDAAGHRAGPQPAV